ncbi:MAG: hypothetical protein P1V18_01560 [Candidatus Gracilibacteria bacterium]|nr:hypothetical protein [Candidatus Gracilibacteria bacterium]
MNKIVSTVVAGLLSVLIATYWFTPLFDEFVIEKSLKRLCDGAKEEFTEESYTHEYLCLFMDGSEEITE